MVNYCVCAGCNSTTRTGHRVHDFPKDKAILKRWVQFVRFRRADFSVTSVTENAKICSAHFKQEDYDSRDVRMASLGLKSPSRKRLIPTAVPSVHTHLSACPVPRPRRTKVRAARRKRERKARAFPFTPPPLQCHSADTAVQETAVQVNLKRMMVSVGTQTTFGMQTSTPLASPEQTDDEEDPCVFRRLDSRQKKQAWEGIAAKLAATTGVARTGEEVRKKWQDFSSLAKRKAAAVRRDTTATGGGPTTAAPLTLEEERAVSLLGSTATVGIEGGVDVHGGRALDAATTLAAGPSPRPAPPRPSAPRPAHLAPARIATASLATARLARAHLAPAHLATARPAAARPSHLEREKLEVLKELWDTVKEASARDARFQQELLVVKRAKLELEARRLLLAEQKLARPSLSLPVLWPEPEELRVCRRGRRKKRRATVATCDGGDVHRQRAQDRQAGVVARRRVIVEFF
ncbi:hypothetical protein ACEWY4_018241 [Coilia grayii]|uniref:THAP-type domain-containing protein n=1 Tax=Coilia grayii TaxID=363190 RepID=A0ABD1JJ35_9TELE